MLSDDFEITGGDSVRDMTTCPFQIVTREFNFEVRHSPMPPDGTLRIP